MIVIAHRGNYHSAPENSMAAFEAAVVSGCHRIELDVRCSKDGSVFVVHDDSLLRVAGTNVQLSQLNASEVTEFTLPNGEAIPLLDEVLPRFIERIELNIEIKGSSSDLTRAVADQVQQLDERLRDKVIFSSFYPEPLELLAKEYPNLQRAVLWGLDTLTVGKPAYLAPQVYMESCAASIIHPQLEMVGERFMEQATRFGWTVYPWAAMKSPEDSDRPGVWQTLLDLRVDGLCTNYPDELCAFLKSSHDDTASSP